MAARFCDNGNGTISDRKYGLMWSANDAWLDIKRDITFWEEKFYVERLDLAGYDGWRVPSREELKCLMLSGPSFFGEIYFGQPQRTALENALLFQRSFQTVQVVISEPLKRKGTGVLIMLILEGAKCGLLGQL